jgi:uncharacterized membrane protein YbhN (UPF0104 family)
VPSRWRRVGWLLLRAGVLALSAMVLLRSGQYLWREVGTGQVMIAWDYVRQLSWWQASFALLLTLLAYATHIVFEAIGWRCTGRVPSLRLVAAVALVGAGITNSLGQFWLTGGTIRLRLYGLAKFPVGDTAKVSAIVFVSIWLGYVTIVGIVGLLFPRAVEEFLPDGIPRSAVGCIGLSAPALYLIYAAFGQSGKWSFRLLRVSGAVTQISTSVMRVLLSAGALYVLFPETTGVSYFEVVIAFVCGIVAGALGQVPGALGVLEATVVLLIGHRLPAGVALSALVTFRAIYYLFPLIAAATVLGTWELIIGPIVARTSVARHSKTALKEF